MSRRALQHRQRVNRLLTASVAFLLGSAVLIVVVFHGYLAPAYRAWRDADAQQRSLLTASSTLLLAVVLVVLLLLLVTVFGVRRYVHFTASHRRSKPTEVVDAWAESARRMPVPASDADADAEREI